MSQLFFASASTFTANNRAMKTFSDFLEFIGINISIFIVGLIGAVFMAGNQKGMKPWERIFTVFGGAFTANYMTPMVQDYIDISDKLIFGVGFILGYSGLKSLEIILRRFHSKIEENQLISKK